MKTYTPEHTADMLHVDTETVRRLIACAVKIDAGRYRYAGNLVHEFWYDKDPGHYGVGLLADPVNDGAGIVGDFLSASPNFTAAALKPTVFADHYGVAG